MANLPDTPSKSSRKDLESRAKFRKLLDKGFTAVQIAQKLEPDSPRKQKVVRNAVRRMIATEPDLQTAIALEVKGTQIEALQGSTDALVKRAYRGRVDAIKLLYETSGFHNPKVKHEHSGEIQISLNMPRPGAQESLNPGKEDIPEAEVVEES